MTSSKRKNKTYTQQFREELLRLRKEVKKLRIEKEV